jgi:hypothetical protein
MLEEVIAFALVISVFEFVIITMIPPRIRLRILGSHAGRVAFHMGMLLINLWVHWGTVIGTMSATLSFITSIVVIHAAKALFGSITDDRYYKVGLVKYSIGELK